MPRYRGQIHNPRILARLQIRRGETELVFTVVCRSSALSQELKILEIAHDVKNFVCAALDRLLLNMLKSPKVETIMAVMRENSSIADVAIFSHE